MSNLVIIHNDISVQLKSLGEIRFKSPSLKSLDENNIKKSILDLVTLTHFKCGIKIEAKELAILSTAFMNEMEDYSYLTIEELNNCFKSGYKEEYGKYYGLNVKTFISWVVFYINNKRQEEMSKRKISSNVKNEISEEEKRFYIANGMKKCLDNYEENGTVLDGYTHFLYDNFYDDGFLDKSGDFKRKMYDDAKTVLTMQTTNTNANSRNEFKDIKQLKKEILKEKSNVVITKAKEMVVMKFLRETLSSGSMENLRIKYK